MEGGGEEERGKISVRTKRSEKRKYNQNIGRRLPVSVYPSHKQEEEKKKKGKKQEDIPLTGELGREHETFM